MTDHGVTNRETEEARYYPINRVDTTRNQIIRVTTLLDHRPALRGVDNSERRIVTARVS